MRSIVLICALIFVGIVGASLNGTGLVAEAAADTVAGKWTLSVDAPGEAVDVLLDLTQKGDEVSGTMSSTHGSGKITKGIFKEKKLTATITADIQGSPTELQLEGTVDGEKITGALTATGLGTFGFTGAKSK